MILTWHGFRGRQHRLPPSSAPFPGYGVPGEADASSPVITIAGFPDKLVMTSDLCARCGHGLTLRVARGGGPLRGYSVERCHRGRCDNGAPRTRGAHATVPGLLAVNLRLPPPQRLRCSRRAGSHPIVFSASPRERDTATRLAREGAVPQFPARRAEALPGRRAGATAYLETRRPHTIHLNRRARGRGAPSLARGS